MAKKCPYFRFLLMLIPLIPGIPLFMLRGYQFSGALCIALSLLIGIFCLLSLFSGNIAKGIRFTLIILLILGIILAGFTELYIVSNGEAPAAPCDYIIVLGAGLNGTSPSLILQERLDRAYDYLIDHPNTQCIVSGGQGPDEVITEAQCMEDTLIRMGIAENRIWKEDASSSTAENIRNSLNTIENQTGTRPEEVGIVSSEFHIARAKLIAESQGVSPVGIPARTTWLSLKINYYVREIPALWTYLLFGGR